MFRILLTLVLMAVPTALYAQSVTEKLQARQDAFAAKADPAKALDYEEGIRIVAESGVLENAKNIGDIAPDFELQSAVGGTARLSELLKDGPVVLIWYRGEWCPYCNIYLQDISSHKDAFEAAGAQVVAISPETPDHAVSIHDRLHLGFHVVSDVGSKVAEDYGVVYTLPPKISEYLNAAFDLHQANADDRDLLPLSASYVINTNGVISYAYLNADYRKRAETKELIDHVERLKRGGF